jgi:hypothetical protein
MHEVNQVSPASAIAAEVGDVVPVQEQVITAMPWPPHCIGYLLIRPEHFSGRAEKNFYYFRPKKSCP